MTDEAVQEFTSEEYLNAATMSLQRCIKERVREAIDLLDEDDPKVMFIEHERNPMTYRAFIVQGKDRHAFFYMQLGFVPHRAELSIYVSSIEIRDGDITTHPVESSLTSNETSDNIDSEDQGTDGDDG